MSSTKTQAFSGTESEEISEGVWYCKQKDLYWKDGTVYDELSARHNGIIGIGAQLRKLTRVINKNR